MNAEFVTMALIATEHAEQFEQMLDRLKQLAAGLSVNDPVLLKRTAYAFDIAKDLSGVVAFIAELSRIQLRQQERQQAEIIRQYQSSLDALRCQEVSQL